MNDLSRIEKEIIDLWPILVIIISSVAWVAYKIGKAVGRKE
jgi:hypothetical protein